MTDEEIIATAMLLGAEFSRLGSGWTCETGPVALPFPAARTKSRAAELYLEGLGFWIGGDGEIRDCNE